MITGKLPFHDENQKRLVNKIRSMKIPEPKDVSEDAMNLLKRIISKAEERISIDEIINSAFFRKIQPKAVTGITTPDEIMINQVVVNKMERTH